MGLINSCGSGNKLTLPSWSFEVGIACRTAYRTGVSFLCYSGDLRRARGEREVMEGAQKKHIYIYFLLPSRVIRASRLPRPRLKIFALSTSTKCPMTLMRPSKPLLKINFRLRLQIHTPFYQRNIRKHSWLLNPLAPVHLSVCTIHP